MAKEQEIAKRYLVTVARPIATQLVDFGDKLAVGTGAALVLIVSQLGTLSDYIPVLGILFAALFSISSLLAYMIARYSSIQATVIADAEDKFNEITKSLRDVEGFDFNEYKRQIIETSVWPATWTISWGMRKKKKPSDVSTIVIQQSQKVTRWMILQIAAMLLALLVLFGSYAFAPATDALSRETGAALHKP